ncbi:MAG: hypothetical protein J6039_03510 [Alphaproteobacteria bacterium]|nr:hypothetical protein [Alphaproteobacteria bacterium]
MIKNKKAVLYTLTVALGVSTAAAGIALAEYDYGKFYGYEELSEPQPLIGQVPVYVEEPQGIVAGEEIYEEVPVASAPVYNPKDGSLFPGGDCPSCHPKDKDGSLFPGGDCKRCSKQNKAVPGPCNVCEERRIEQVELRNYIPYTPALTEAMYRECCQMAPISLEYVDFRIKNNGADGPYHSKLGNYRFRIFGCRRFSKEAHLNSGQIMEKNLNFRGVFEETVGDCYKIIPMPKDLCLQTTPVDLPEYVLTAEISDYFMNVCDEYDWKDAEKKESRKGSSEITITWRLMDLTKTKVFWKGETTGYGELYEGEKNGEEKLIERAFADATSNLRSATGFEDQLMIRVNPLELATQRNALIEEERALNPLKCGYRKQYECEKNCQISRPGVDLNQCNTNCNCNCNCNCGCNGGCGCNCNSCEQGGVVSEGCCSGGCCNTCEQGGVSGEGCCSGGCCNQTIETSGGVYVENAPCPESCPQVEVGETVVVDEVINDCIDENGELIKDGSCQVVDDTWVDTGDVNSLDGLCIVDANPCQALTPETVYRMRSSVVEVNSPNGRKGAGLLISDRYILTSGDLIDAQNNSYLVKTIRNVDLQARAIRVNPSKNTALLMLDKSTEYTPLALNLSLPEVGKNGFLTLGVLDVKNFKSGQDYLENSARIEGYRYSEEKGAEIIANTFVQNVTVGGALFYKNCTVSGMAQSGVRTNEGLDSFIPTETALRSLGISICGHEYVEESPWQQTVYKPVTEQIKVVQEAPKVPEPKEVK